LRWTALRQSEQSVCKEWVGDSKDGADAKRAREAASRGREIL
jgi:hypothetical protein